VIPAPVGILSALVLLAIGMQLGWRWTRPDEGQEIVGWREMWRHGPDPSKYRRNPKAFPVALKAFATGFLATGLALFGDYFGSKTAVLLFGSCVTLCVRIGWGAILGGFLRGTIRR
jgi:hypothetical protein